MIYSGNRINQATFVGRLDAIEAITRHQAAGKSWVLSAGRRLGKTSLLRRYAAQTSPDSVAYLDRQALGPSAPPSDFFSRIGNPAHRALGGRGVPPTDVTSLEEALVAFAQPYLILLDEADSLTRFPWGLAALENLRYVVSNSRVAGSCSVGLSGGPRLKERLRSAGSHVTNVCVDMGLSPLDRRDVGELVAIGFVGDHAGEIADFVWDRVGGHPYLAQGLLEAVEEAGWPLNDAMQHAFASNVEVAIENWIRDAGDHIAGPEVRLDGMRSSEVRLLTCSGLYRLENDRLVANGSLVRSFLQRRLGPGSTLDQCLALGECETVEFKSTLRYDIKNQRASKDIERAAVKTVAAMMNSNGGTLIIGVADDEHAVGIETDYPTLRRRDRDGWELALRQILSSALSAEIAAKVAVRYEVRDDETVALIGVGRSSESVWVSDGQTTSYFIRVGNLTQLLDARETVAHIERCHHETRA
jgi:Putative DNA-binding domain